MSWYIVECADIIPQSSHNFIQYGNSVNDAHNVLGQSEKVKVTVP